ncbi:hypothetical protein LNP07_06740 [Apilactobacillus sp. M161]|uniref:Uncharacterized protein n=1 Tax=Apilactobacillus xinyiensis TaxID=2841032 RepID=A0ABT0I3C8_9LACO|nr:hypothetical protein [Apilactobacillus xinyiensis]MCK8625211.1 hypothetical protein [Apilactobacillus xinyiensis]
MSDIKLKLIVLKKDYFDLVQDKELLINPNGSKRACLLCLKLKYKGSIYNFALPWRSNVANDPILDEVVYSLPKTSKTRKYHRACLDFSKMAPLTSKSKCLYSKYKVNKINDFATLLYIEKNFDEIIEHAKEYLLNREKQSINNKIKGLVDIDKAIDCLKKNGY